VLFRSWKLARELQRLQPRIISAMIMKECELPTYELCLLLGITKAVRVNDDTRRGLLLIQSKAKRDGRIERRDKLMYRLRTGHDKHRNWDRWGSAHFSGALSCKLTARNWRNDETISNISWVNVG
jgi:hypothetical protein